MVGAIGIVASVFFDDGMGRVAVDETFFDFKADVLAVR